MPSVHLPAALADKSAGSTKFRADAATVREALRQLEASHPALKGWILDERSELRRHVTVFVNDERRGLEHPLVDSDEIHVVQAISGGSAVAYELLVGTRKGLFVVRGDRDGSAEVAGRAFAGQVVEYACRDPRSGTYLASVTHGQFGPHVYVADDPLGEWRETEGPAFPEDVDAAVERVWVIEPGESAGELWAGVSPAALFRSEDGGVSWGLNRALWDDPTRESWQPGFGGLCLHTIVPWPGDPARLAVAISAAGVWLSDDGGESWRRGVEGLVPRYLPQDARADAVDLCVHKMMRSLTEPSTLYLQFHGGVYRSDDAGESWSDISAGLPADFGFPIVADPVDPDRAWVIPLVADTDRVTPDGAVRVYETSDRGRSWTARTEGLPQSDAHLTVLRQAFCHDGEDPLGLFFGAESGELFGSFDRARSWRTLALRLPPIVAVRAAGTAP